MKKPVSREIQLKYYPNPAAEKIAVKALISAMEEVRLQAKTKTIRRNQSYEKSA